MSEKKALRVETWIETFVAEAEDNVTDEMLDAADKEYEWWGLAAMASIGAAGFLAITGALCANYQCGVLAVGMLLVAYACFRHSLQRQIWRIAQLFHREEQESAEKKASLEKS